MSWIEETLQTSPPEPEFSALEPFGLDAPTSSAPSAQETPSTLTTAKPASLPLTSEKTDQSSGTATTADGPEAPVLTEAHRRRLRERKLDPTLCARYGVYSVDNKTLGFRYVVNGQEHNTKLRRGKGNMPWSHAGKDLVLWNVDCLKAAPEAGEEVIITEGEFDALSFIQAGYTRVVSVPNGAQSTEKGFSYLGRDTLHSDLEKFGRYVIATDGDAKGRACRDALAVRLGDERCRSIIYPEGAKDANDVMQQHGPEALRALVDAARPMWVDEICRMSDVPDPPAEEPRYRTGIHGLDHHGLRITLPAFFALVGPYASGKSVLMRQLLCNLYKLHNWRCLLTAFEERVKPRFERDLRRHFIGRPKLPDDPWTDEEISEADAKIEDAFVFFKRARGKPIDMARLLDRIEYAVKVYGVKVVCIDPINEVQLQTRPGQSKTDLMGELIMALKDLAEDYQLLVIVAAHTSKDSTEKRLKKRALLTLNDGEDTRHWGGKADIGWCVWRPPGGNTILNVDKVKDHETMGRPEVFELELNRAQNSFDVVRVGREEIVGTEYE